MNHKSQDRAAGMEVGNKVVAIIDDDQDDLEIMEHVIKEIDPNIQCQFYIYPEEALTSLLVTGKKRPPDYVFIDINMPGLRGDKCLELLRGDETLEDTKIIMYSTSMPDDVALKLRNSGANFVFQKPERLKVYTEILASILRTY